MYLELEKIKQATAYFAQKVPNLYFTKYLKLMYYFDFISVLERGRPVTNDTYYHLPFGPVPTVIKDQLALLRDEIRTGEQNLLSENGGTTDLRSFFSDVVTLTEASTGSILEDKKSITDFSSLSEYEVTLLNDIIEQFKDISVKDIVDKTHREIPYLQTPSNNIIDYKLAFYLERDEILPKRKHPLNLEVSQMEFYNR